MRPHKIEPYRSVFDATAGPGCPLCRYMRNYQAKCVQASLTPRPKGICNFHAWAIAAIHDRLDASQVFLNLLSSASLGGTMDCDICLRLAKEDAAQLRLVSASFKTLSAVHWLNTYGEICIPHSIELRKQVSLVHVPAIDRAVARYRDKLIRSLQEQQGVDIEGAGWGVLAWATPRSFWLGREGCIGRAGETMENDKTNKPQPKQMSRFNQINFRAGILGFPFCVVEYYLKRGPIFLLGGGFFAALLVMGFFEWRKSGYARIWASHVPSVKKNDQADIQ